MAHPSAYPLPRERTLILALLGALAAAGWGVLLWQSASMQRAAMERPDSPTGASMDGLTLGMTAPLFLAMWIAMMVAMMFPTAAPMIVMFSRVHAGKRDRGDSFVPTWLFVSAYLLM